jgi:broad specificity phosphatase PhoE
VIIFVRHGQTEVNREGRLQGRLDAPLTALGREQARHVATGLAGSAATAVVTSPLRRAADTAHEIASVLGVEVELDDRLVEVDYGEWDGRKFSEVAPEEWGRWRDDVAFVPPGGESLLTVATRVGDFCSARLRGDRTIVAVSHVSPIKAAVVWALGISEEATWRMHLDVASVTRIGRRGDGPPFLAGYNDVSHLPARDGGE